MSCAARGSFVALGLNSKHLAWLNGAIERIAGGTSGEVQLNAWKKQRALCEHELPGTTRHDPLAYLQNRTADWLDHQLAARGVQKLTRYS